MSMCRGVNRSPVYNCKISALKYLLDNICTLLCIYL